jgi:hypothetical protein
MDFERVIGSLKTKFNHKEEMGKKGNNFCVLCVETLWFNNEIRIGKITLKAQN